MISPAGLKKSLTCFFTPFANRFFGGRVFFRFRTKKEMRRGLRRQSSVFLHAIRKRNFWRQSFFHFRTKKEMRRGAEMAVWRGSSWRRSSQNMRIIYQFIPFRKCNVGECTIEDDCRLRRHARLQMLWQIVRTAVPVCIWRVAVMVNHRAAKVPTKALSHNGWGGSPG